MMLPIRSTHPETLELAAFLGTEADQQPVARCTALPGRKLFFLDRKSVV